MRQLMISGFFATSLACAMLSGCGRPPEKPPEAPPPEVTVCLPIVNKITDFNDFEGRTRVPADRRHSRPRQRISGTGAV